MRIAIVITVRNEARSVRHFLDSVLAQTMHPDEIVIVDGGSTDSTWAILQEYAARTPLLTVVNAPGANIAAGRNRGIAQSNADVIAVTDAGCELEPDWLEKISTPFQDPMVNLVGGFYEPTTDTRFQQVAMILTLPIYKPLQGFLPSSRSFAFRKWVWAKAGGYPEWLYTAEDTYFVLQLKQQGHRIHIARDALVKWQPREGWNLWRQYRNYARGDGHAKLFLPIYIAKLVLYIGFGMLLALGVAGLPLATAVAAVLLLLYMARYGVRVRKVNADWKALLLTPAVLLFLDSASLSGFILGVQEGKPRVLQGGGTD